MNAPGEIFIHIPRVYCNSSWTRNGRKLSLEDHVRKCLKINFLQIRTKSGKIQLKHLLCMSSVWRHFDECGQTSKSSAPEDFEKYMMAQPVPVWSQAVHSAIPLMKVWGLSYGRTGRWQADGSIYEKVFQPLIWDGRSGSMIHRDIRMAAEVYLTCTEMMKLGQLYLAEGNWKEADCQQRLVRGPPRKFTFSHLQISGM